MALDDLYDPTDLIPVTREHLEDFYNAFTRAHGYLYAMDLADGYRQGKHTPKGSSLTNHLARVARHAEGYLNDVDVSPE